LVTHHPLHIFRRVRVAAALAAIAFPGAAQAQAPAAPSAEAAAFFEKSIRPVLAEKCVPCHGDKVQSANLRLDSLAGLNKGGDGGAVVDRAAPDKSRILAAIQYGGAVKMPPSGKLPDKTIADFSAWLHQGAPWPAGSVARGKSMEERIADARLHLWSLKPVRKPAMPAVQLKSWVRTPIDRLVLAKMEAQGIAPAKSADRKTLIRRATFDLTGLPPTPAEVDAFLSDKAPDAYEKLIDRLLASPHYGERWGRHWLDVARYSDTLGYLVGNVGDPGRIYPYAYTYRDYVVRSLNEDKPYDLFVKEQLAADQMELKDKRDLAALGFITVGNHYLGNGQEIIDDRIDVVCRGLQAMTVGCARCHDHKFDPIPAADYYGLYGVFNSIHEPGDLPLIGEPEDKKAFNAFMAKYTPLEQKRLQLIKDKKNDDANKVRDQIKMLELNDPGAPPRAMVVEDNEHPDEPHILLRGNPATPGASVSRHFLQAVLGENSRPFSHGSGRLDLAEQIASRDNPLTARVFVNRVWMYHFGKPLVATPSDFGVRGEPPVQPQLLDYLASSFMENGWSIKKLHREIMLSNAYKQSSDAPALTLKKDPENRYISRMNRRRMEFEPLRDTLLCVAGNLDTSVGGRPLPALFTSNARRTLYTFVDRQDLPGVLRSFDFADPGAHSPIRSVTTVPQQALFFMNNPFVLEQVRGVLSRPDIAGIAEPTRRINALFRELYSRSATPTELASSLKFLSGWKSRLPEEASAGSAWINGYGTYTPEEHRVTKFEKLPFFTGNAWQGGDKLPDKKLGWVTLRADGGHPGDPGFSAIRRWTAPADLKISVQGTLNHPGKVGDGVEAFIVSSVQGCLGDWVAQGSVADTGIKEVTVQKGEILDFVVSCRKDTNTDSFQWAPVLEALPGSKAAPGGIIRWDAAADFSGPMADTAARKPMTAWEVYVQALLMTNEFLFID
jgi:cytochrome c553